MTPRLMAILEVDAEALRRFLQLPDAAEITDCRMDFSTRGRIGFKIEGAGFPTVECGAIRCTTCLVHTDSNSEAALNPRLEWIFSDGFGEEN